MKPAHVLIGRSFGEKREFSLLRAVQLGTPDLDAAGGACAAAKYDGVLLTAPSRAAAVSRRGTVVFETRVSKVSFPECPILFGK